MAIFDIQLAYLKAHLVRDTADFLPSFFANFFKDREINSEEE